MLARVTIIGRPNVGKSSIFNSLSGHRIAIISDIENTTRDIIEYHIDDMENEVSYMMADSGGIVQADNETLLNDVRSRANDAINSSDLILFVLEYDRMTDFDEFIVKLLRRSKKPVLVVANKADNPKRAMEAYQHLSLGLGDVVPVSAVQTRGFGELKSKVAEMLKELGFGFIKNETHEGMLRLAIIGRPNVGKSSLVNAIAGETRSIVYDMPGTTRDAIDTVIKFKDEDIVLIDTAGIRRAGKIGSANIEQWSVMRAEKSVERSDVVAVVMDAFEGIAHQDEHIVGEAMKEKKGIILVVNKWDKVMNKPGVNKDTILERYMHYLSKKFDFLSYAPVVFTSAIENKRIDLVLEHAIKIREERNKRVKTGVFNKFLEQITYDHAPTGNRKSHKPRIYYGSQVDVNPPKFMISVNNSEHFHFSYVRYIENKIREIFGFEGTPIEIELRSRKSMFKPKEQGGSREEHFGEEIVELEKKIADKKIDTFGKKKPRKKR
ncbi:ribosome biogenesis GTPase Der [Candidatus Gracilibacteria bacterium]|nr:ribosome biogenesis GTPase Der [Candidatus Gracilibacteria bacterium]